VTHPRKAIRLAVRDAIEAANTFAQDRVWASEQPPVDVENVLISEGPAILVYTRRDRAVEYPPTGTDGAVKRELDLCVEILAAGSLAVDDKLDDAAEQVEALLQDFEVPGLPATEIRLHETNVEVADQFHTPVGGAFLMFTVVYWMPWRVPVPEEDYPCPIDVGLKVNGGPRERVDVECGCDE